MSNSGRSNWRAVIAPYERPDTLRSIWQMVNTLVPFFVLWFAAYRGLAVSYWLTLALALPAAGLLVRIFILFHDCCHGSFFANRKANDVVGTLTGILTFAPYAQWRRSHNVHHATAGNLDRRGMGDIMTLTVDEYLALPLWERIGYRFYRNPLVMFGLGPAAVFLIQYRFNRKGAGLKERLNVYLTNAGIAAVVALLCWAIGWQAFLLVHAPIFLISGAAGFWLFYVQHQFEGTYYQQGSRWDYVRAALEGSSFYKLPKVLDWFTGSIGYHHIHHLSPRVPNYRLERAHEENPMFQEIEPVTLWSSFKSLGFRLWDEHRERLVGFGYVRQFQAARRQGGPSPQRAD